MHVEQIDHYAHELTSVLLRTETRITNHGYWNGSVTTFASVLEAGTAVLVDHDRLRRAALADVQPVREVGAVSGLPQAQRARGTPWWCVARPASACGPREGDAPVFTLTTVKLATIVVEDAIASERRRGAGGRRVRDARRRRPGRGGPPFARRHARHNPRRAPGPALGQAPSTEPSTRPSLLRPPPAPPPTPPAATPPPSPTQPSSPSPDFSPFVGTWTSPDGASLRIQPSGVGTYKPAQGPSVEIHLAGATPTAATGTKGAAPFT